MGAISPLGMVRSGLRLSIRGKLVLAMLGIIVSFGAIHLWVVNRTVSAYAAKVFTDNGVLNARLLANELEAAVLRDDRPSVEKWLWKWQGLDEQHRYAMVVSSDTTVFASTFRNGVPIGLRTINLGGGNAPGIVRVDDRGTMMIDIAIPLVDGIAGRLRLGILEAPASAPTVYLRWMMIAMIAGFVILGLVGAFVLSRRFTSPILLLVNRFRTVDLDREQEKLELRTGDEWEQLAQSFSEMAERLWQSHQQLLEFTEKGKEAEKLAALGLMASGVAHEISNPIAGIEMGLRRIQRQPENTEQIARYLPTMLESLGHVQTIVRQMLSYARPEAVIPARHTLGVLLDQSLLLIEHRLNVPGVTLSREVRAEAVGVYVDAQSIVQVFTNLLTNAIDALNGDGRVEVTVSKDRERVMVGIHDNGTGILAENLPRIWEPFYTTKSSGVGTGLGLSVTRSLVEKNHGTISVESAVGVGTTFTLTLPRSEAQD